MLMHATSDLDFFGRLKSFIGHGLTRAIYPHMMPNRETEIFRRLLRPDFPDLMELAKKVNPVSDKFHPCRFL